MSQMKLVFPQHREEKRSETYTNIKTGVEMLLDTDK